MVYHKALLAFALLAAQSPAGAVTISSVRELAACAAQNNQTVVLRPGVYRVSDYLSPATIQARRQRKEWAFLDFSGSNNVFQLEGVTLELDTELRRALRPPIHTSDFVITGSSNLFRGLTLTNAGDGTSPGGAALSITGPGNTLRDCTLHVRGSFPYGYGDLFGKGSPNVINHQKKSGVHVTGHGTSLFGCNLYMRSFGHGYFVQRDARDVRFEDCYVEGVMRSTDDMLSETDGPAFKVGFRTVARNRAGENKVTPGYMKALSEDGFRTYGQHTNLTFKNCTAKNMRGGFELRTKTDIQLENCSAIGCERGFWVSTGAKVVSSRGDAQYGPLLFTEGDEVTVDLELLPAESNRLIHALATICGSGHRVTIKPAAQGNRTRPLPILAGYATPMMGEGMAPIPEHRVRNLVLRNETTMPVILSSAVSGAEIISRGPVRENQASGVKVRQIE